MKKIILMAFLAFWALGVAAQNISFSQNVPAEAAAVLESRLAAMLKSAGVADAPLAVDAEVTDRMETSGSIAQTALTVELKLTSGSVTASFPLKGVGADESDAWVRACKQFLPRSSATQEFTDRLKRKM